MDEILRGVRREAHAGDGEGVAGLRRAGGKERGVSYI